MRYANPEVVKTLIEQDRLSVFRVAELNILIGYLREVKGIEYLTIGGLKANIVETCRTAIRGGAPVQYVPPPIQPRPAPATAPVGPWGMPPPNLLARRPPLQPLSSSTQPPPAAAMPQTLPQTSAELFEKVKRAVGRKGTWVDMSMHDAKLAVTIPHFYSSSFTLKPPSLVRHLQSHTAALILIRCLFHPVSRLPSLASPFRSNFISLFPRSSTNHIIAPAYMMAPFEVQRQGRGVSKIFIPKDSTPDAWYFELGSWEEWHTGVQLKLPWPTRNGILCLVSVRARSPDEMLSMVYEQSCASASGGGGEDIGPAQHPNTAIPAWRLAAVPQPDSTTEPPRTSLSISKYEHELPSSLHTMRERIAAAKKLTADDEGVEIGDETVYFRCPLTLVRVQHPCKGQQCTHVDAFDAESFLVYAKNLDPWECVVSRCGKILTFEDLRIDPLLYDALKQYPDDDRCIVRADGTHARLPNPSPTPRRDDRPHHPFSTSCSPSPPPVFRKRTHSLSPSPPPRPLVVIDVDALDLDDTPGASPGLVGAVAARRKKARVGRPAPAQPTTTTTAKVTRVVNLCSSDEDEMEGVQKGVEKGMGVQKGVGVGGEKSATRKVGEPVDVDVNDPDPDATLAVAADANGSLPNENEELNALFKHFLGVEMR
ncbi:hypothetical protein M427DRAFT_156993 [Gonapodya prolifera JEL478]|uniref:SP-RING-type domain-containing protein n=1 Tax=Gonapodya prolifera (strain JEL478) TaxID=1344416 RepID=A0A139A836_GONPJ|nr:hypothetical protein M427DRAFT_156993 [Gonapodya prolifera JEL478]|eukprot:KXS12966.1 hypothetical protein M427DRAFT_156993 [Gonapodya prolifera JEL478]